MNEILRTQAMCDSKNSVVHGLLGLCILGCCIRYQQSIVDNSTVYRESGSLLFSCWNLGIPSRSGQPDAFSRNIESWVSDAKRDGCLEIIHGIRQSCESSRGSDKYPVPVGASWGVTPDVSWVDLLSPLTIYWPLFSLWLTLWAICCPSNDSFFSDQVTPELVSGVFFCNQELWLIRCPRETVSCERVFKRPTEEKDLRTRVYRLGEKDPYLEVERHKKTVLGTQTPLLETKKMGYTWELPNEILHASWYLKFI